MPLYKKFDEVLRPILAAAARVEDAHQGIIVFLVLLILEIERVQGGRAHDAVLMSRTPHVLVETERLQRFLPRLMQFEGIQPAEDRAGVVNLALGVLPGEKVTAPFVATKGHNVPVAIAVQPGRVGLGYLTDLVGRQKLEEILGTLPRFTRDTNHVPGRGEAHYIRAAVKTVAARKSHRFPSHGRIAYMVLGPPGKVMPIWAHVLGGKQCTR